MRGTYFQAWMRLVSPQLEPHEEVLAKGRAFEPTYWDGLDLARIVSGLGSAAVLTSHRLLWLGRDEDKWTRVLPLASLRAYTELVQTHRYAIAFEHEGVDVLMWAPQHRYPWGTWGDGEKVESVEKCILAFSHRDTALAHALRGRLDELGAQVHPAKVVGSAPVRGTRGMLLRNANMISRVGWSR